MRSCLSSSCAVSAICCTSALLRPFCGTSSETGPPRRWTSQLVTSSGSSTSPASRIVRGKRVAVVADHLALAHVRHLDEDVAALARVRDQVLVLAAAGEHLLAVGDLLDRHELVAIAGRVLEVERVGQLRHLVPELPGQLV